MTPHFTHELLRLREEVLRAHAWSAEGAPSKLEERLSGLPQRLKALIGDLSIDATYSLRPALLEASYDKNRSSDSQHETAEYVTSMGALFRRFKERDSLDLPIVLSLIVLSRLFQQLFPSHAFEARTQHSKHGDTKGSATPGSDICIN